MKKVGLITFHRPVNFGAALQSVALYRALKDLGAKCDILNYINPSFEKAYRIFKIEGEKSLKSLIWNVLMVPHRYRKNTEFRKFVKENTQLTKPIKTKEELKKYGDIYDTYISGSDQVWNLKCSGGEKAYFLDFVINKSKNSYAASFGDADVDEKNTEEYQKMLADFSKISVREEAGKTIVKKISGQDSVQTLDPTLLLNKQQWSALIENREKLFSEKYVLIYFMAQSEEIKEQMMSVAKKIAKEKDCKIVVIGGSFHKRKDDIYYINVESPYGFLTLFRDATYVVTNSFHGTAFSVNFEKNFYSYVKPDLKVEGRVENLLKIIKLENRIFSFSEQIENVSDIDYLSAKEYLENARKDSVEFLRGIVNE